MRPFPAMSLAWTLLALPAASPAQIAPGGQPRTPPGPVDVRIEPATSGDYELRRSRDAISDGRKNGTLTKSEARALRREANQNDVLAQRHGRDGLSQSEQREIDTRGRALRSLTEARRAQPKRP